MSKSEKTVVLTYARTHSESFVRQVAADPENWNVSLAEACKAWVEANPEKEALPDDKNLLARLRELRLGNHKRSPLTYSAFIKQIQYLQEHDLSRGLLDDVRRGDYDEELGLTEIIRMLGEL